jgi:NADPH2:quinone reductase
VVVTSPEHLFPLPDSLSYLQGACLPLNYLTAHYALITRGRLQAGETVLIHGASGGVGTAAIQVAAAFGGRVIAVVSGEDRRSVARDAGAAAVVLADGFGARVRELTGGVGVDIVLDPVGGEQRVTESLRALAPLGRLLVAGFAGGEIASVKLNRLLLSNTDVRGIAWGPYSRLHPQFPGQQWAELLPLVESGALAPVIGAVYPLAETARALADLAQRRLTDKAVLSLREAVPSGGAMAGR